MIKILNFVALRVARDCVALINVSKILSLFCVVLGCLYSMY